MSGTATLTREPAATSSMFAASLPPPPRIASLRGALVVATFSMAVLSTETAKLLVLSFDGSVATLGRAASYWDSVATLCGWLLAAGALLLACRAATSLGASRRVRIGDVVAAAGAVLLSFAAACSVWATAVYNHATIAGGGVLSSTKASTITHEVVELSKASLVLEAAGFLVLAIGAFAARSQESRFGARGQRVLVTLGVAAVLAAIAPGVAFVLVLQGRSTTGGQLVTIMMNVPTVLSWFAVAVGLLLAASALGASERTARLSVAAPIGALGAFILAISSAAVLAVDELVLTGTGAGWLANLSKLTFVAAWLGWLLLSVGFGVAATRLQEHEVLTSTIQAAR
jgi:hypothetical protein